jgi:hypothetical protein
MNFSALKMYMNNQRKFWKKQRKNYAYSLMEVMDSVCDVKSKKKRMKEKFPSSESQKIDWKVHVYERKKTKESNWFLLFIFQIKLLHIHKWIKLKNLC